LLLWLQVLMLMLLLVGLILLRGLRLLG